MGLRLPALLMSEVAAIGSVIWIAGIGYASYKYSLGFLLLGLIGWLPFTFVFLLAWQLIDGRHLDF